MAERGTGAGMLQLNKSLFDRIAALEAEDLTDEELERELKKADAVTKVAGCILQNAALALKAQQMFEEYGTGQTVDVPLLGISNEGLREENRNLRRRLASKEDFN